MNKKDSGQLHGELMSSLLDFTKELGYHLPPEEIFDTTTSLINLFIRYEKYRESILENGKKVLEKGFGELPVEVQNKIKEQYERRK
ncbi:MAG: hypothetical protein CL842_12835 [Crocinitomicaceae bacterium]|nr:hypothetical protein [Crocinitomicaceae bacterium]|tara:strand:- start:125 stop:382 length:258 start_codon:yes stop_codon:yes gene_type:complete